MQLTEKEFNRLTVTNGRFDLEKIATMDLHNALACVRYSLKQHWPVLDVFCRFKGVTDLLKKHNYTVKAKINLFESRISRSMAMQYLDDQIKDPVSRRFEILSWSEES